MKKTSILLSAILMTFGIGCADIQNTQAGLGCDTVTIGDVVVKIPATDDEFEVTLIDKSNRHLIISHEKDNASLDIEIEDAKWGSIEDIRQNLSNGKNKISKWKDGYKVEVYHEQIEKMGHDRFIYFRPIDKSRNVIFTQYDFTDGRHDRRIAEMVDAITIVSTAGKN